MTVLPQEELAEEQVELAELENSLGFLLRLAQVKIYQAFFERLSKYGLKPGEFTVLWVIGLNPGLRQGTIARCLNIKPAHMTKLTRRMVEAGHVRRTVPEDDRRSVRLSLTDEGQAFVDRYKDDFLSFHAEEREEMTDAEFAQFLQLLRKFTGLPRPAG